MLRCMLHLQECFTGLQHLHFYDSMMCAQLCKYFSKKRKSLPFRSRRKTKISRSSCGRWRIGTKLKTSFGGVRVIRKCFPSTDKNNDEPTQVHDVRPYFHVKTVDRDSPLPLSGKNKISLCFFSMPARVYLCEAGRCMCKHKISIHLVHEEGMRDSRFRKIFFPPGNSAQPPKTTEREIIENKSQQHTFYD